MNEVSPITIGVVSEMLTIIAEPLQQGLAK